MKQYRVSLGRKHEEPLIVTVMALNEDEALKNVLSLEETIKHFDGCFPMMRFAEPVYNRENLSSLLDCRA